MPGLSDSVLSLTGGKVGTVSGNVRPERRVSNKDNAPLTALSPSGLSKSILSLTGKVTFGKVGTLSLSGKVRPERRVSNYKDNAPLTAEDGARLGRQLTRILRKSHTANIETQKLLIEDFLLNENSSLSSICTSTPLIRTLITTFATNKSFKGGKSFSLLGKSHFPSFLVKKNGGGDKSDEPHIITEAVVEKVAAEFAFMMLISTSPEIALDEWIVHHKEVLDPIFAAHSIWLKPLLLQLSSLLLNELSRWRIWPSALIAFFDHFSDVIMVAYYVQNEEQSAALAMLGILVLHTVGQSVFISNQYGHFPRRQRAFEYFFVITGLSSVRNAFNALKPDADESKLRWKVVSFFHRSKMIECICESIPTLFVQISSLEEGSSDTLPIVSIALSVLTTSFVFATINFDGDTDPQQKFENSYTGIINESKRVLAYFALFTRGFCQLSLRMMLVFFLFRTDKHFEFLLMSAAEYVIMMIPQVYNGLRHPKQNFGYGTLLIMTIPFYYILHTFLFLFKAYHPKYAHFGGWLVQFEFVASISLPWVGFLLAGSYAEKYSTPLIVLSIMNVVSHVLIIFCITKEKRIWYIWNNGTINNHHHNEFNRTEIDEIKVSAATVNKYYTRGWRHEIEAWFVANYRRWKSEKKAFLEKDFMFFIDEEWIAKAGGNDRDRANYRESKRRGSFVPPREEYEK